MVDHDVHRVAAFGKKTDPGVNVLGSNQRSKIPCVFSYQHEVEFNASGQGLAVGRAQPAEVTRINGDMCALGIERLPDPRRQALIEKQAHVSRAACRQAALRQGLPDGRPRSGWARA